ncbi:MAG: penicillin-binding protein activator, partial [Usitatibacter sp.]
MSRFNAILLFALASLVSPAFSADPSAGTTFVVPGAEDIDPSTGLLRSTVVRPLSDAPPVPDARQPPRPAGPARPHVALILPTASPALGRLAEALRLGFVAAAEAAGKEGVPVTVTAIESESATLIEACRQSQSSGAMLVVAGLTRDGAQALAASDCPRQPVLALNELRGEIPANVYSVSLSLEQEARQAALLAVADGWRAAIVIASPSASSRRVQEAFEREWTRAAGETRRIAFGGNPEEAPAIRDRLANMCGDMVFFALDQDEARTVRPYVPATLPVYATSMSVNPRAEAIVNLDLQGLRYEEMPWFIQPDHPAVMVYPQPRIAMSVEQERLYALGIDAYRLATLIVRDEAAKH